MGGFPCTNCGACCKSIAGIDFLAEFDLGNGHCKFLNAENNQCAIYQERPSLCRIDESYEKIFFNQFSKEEFYKINAIACNELQSKLGIPEKFRVQI